MYEDARLQSTTSKKKLYVRKMLHMNPSGTAASSMLGMMKNTNGLILTFPTLKQPVLFLYHRIVPRALKRRCPARSQSPFPSQHPTHTSSRAWSPQKCLGGFLCVFPNAWFQVLSFCLSPREPSACLHGVLSLGMPSIITEMGPSARACLPKEIHMSPSSSATDK